MTRTLIKGIFICLSNNFEIDESFGFNTEGEGEGVILPSTIIPYVDDFFMIDYMNEDYLFHITKIEYDKVYKISLWHRLLSSFCLGSMGFPTIFVVSDGYVSRQGRSYSEYGWRLRLAYVHTRYNGLVSISSFSVANVFFFHQVTYFRRNVFSFPLVYSRSYYRTTRCF